MADSTSPARQPLPLVELDATNDGELPGARADVELTIGGWPILLAMTVPTDDVTLSTMLPFFQGFTETVMDVAVRNVEDDGLKISCRKGCGACCRQVVPVSETETRMLRAIVEQLPSEKKGEVKKRFQNAVQRLGEAGLLETFRNPGQATGEEWRNAGLSYFQLGIACPFLEEESCSIHPVRPLACREYMVTSPAVNCSSPTAETVKCVPLPVATASKVRKLDRQQTEAGWVPLILALEWAEGHKAPPVLKPGTEWLQDFFHTLTS